MLVSGFQIDQTRNSKKKKKKSVYFFFGDARYGGGLKLGNKKKNKTIHERERKTKTNQSYILSKNKE